MRAAALAFCLIVFAVDSGFAIEYAGRVVAVKDGDTIELLTSARQLMRIRLSGIDAPEKQQPFGQKSKQLLSDLAFNRQAIVHVTKKDRYGRFVGKVVVGRIDANLQMVRGGMAWHYKKYQNEQSEEDRRIYRDAEEAARLRKLGLWTDRDPVAPWEFRQQRRNGFR